MTLPLSEWESFYVIVGSSAGALTGLQFVVMALIADLERRPNAETIGAFASPNIVHFCIVLFISAVMSAPWRTISGVAWIVGLTGLGGIIYASIVTMRTRRQEGYKPVLEDWMFHIILPFTSYALLLIASVVLLRSETVALFLIALVALMLMFIGIHNAWDTVTYLITERFRPRREQQP